MADLLLPQHASLGSTGSVTWVTGLANCSFATKARQAILFLVALKRVAEISENRPPKGAIAYLSGVNSLLPWS